MTTLFPPIDPNRQLLDAPIERVTLFEDRATVTRRGQISLAAGRQRLYLPNLAPVMQDVSLRAEVSQGPAEVTNARVQRALRALQAQKPEEIQAADAEIKALRATLGKIQDDQRRATHRYGSVIKMLAQGAQELPEDVAWGLVDGDAWRQTFATLFQRSRDLLDQTVQAHRTQKDRLAELANAVQRRRQLSAQHHDMVAWVELDVSAEAAGVVEIIVEYTTPNAMWRPTHTARLDTADNSLSFTSSAAIWQRTGEDWRDVEIVCSTARASLGTEPPLLSDDLLQAKRKSDTVKLAAREVAVQSTGPSTEAAPPARVDLPGVDDGGEVRNLVAPRRADVLSDGHANIIPLFSFEADAEVRYVLMAEVTEAVFLKSTQRNTGTNAILAGPVELIRDAGSVGWSEVLFVTPGAAFELGFGPQDELRVFRESKTKEIAATRLDKWTHQDHFVRLYLSNIGGEPRMVQITERIPVSEVEEIKITLDDDKTSSGYTVNEQGFCTWETPLEGHDHKIVSLDWRLSVAPDVDFRL